MDSRRQLKVASLIKEAFTEVLIKEGRKFYGNAFVTLSNVKVNSDLTLARFYLSIYNNPMADEIIENFNAHKGELKHALAEKVRHLVRRIPEIEFFKDETMDYVFHLEEVFSRIKAEDEDLKEILLEKETRAKKQEPRAKSQETRAKKQEPRNKSQETRAKSQETRNKSQETKGKTQEPKAKKAVATKKELPAKSKKAAFTQTKTRNPK